MKFVPYVNFDGTCAEAFAFYAECLGGKIAALFTFGDTPAAEHVPASHRGRIMHARLEVEGQAIMGSDGVPDHPCEGVKGCYIALQVDSVAQGEKFFNALSKNATVQMPWQQTFWSAGFGMLVDQYGIPWMINCEKEN